MFAEIKEATGIDAELVSGSGGIFDVKRDGVMLFSKHQLDRFPRIGEITELLS